MLLHPQPAIDFVRIFFGHLQAAFETEKIGRVQQIDMQRVTFDPFAAIQQPSQAANSGVISMSSAASSAWTLLI